MYDPDLEGDMIREGRAAQQYEDRVEAMIDGVQLLPPLETTQAEQSTMIPWEHHIRLMNEARINWEEMWRR